MKIKKIIITGDEEELEFMKIILTGITLTILFGLICSVIGIYIFDYDSTKCNSIDMNINPKQYESCQLILSKTKWSIVYGVGSILTIAVGLFMIINLCDPNEDKLRKLVKEEIYKSKTGGKK